MAARCLAHPLQHCYDQLRWWHVSCLLPWRLPLSCICWCQASFFRSRGDLVEPIRTNTKQRGPRSHYPHLCSYCLDQTSVTSSNWRHLVVNNSHEGWICLRGLLVRGASKYVLKGRWQMDLLNDYWLIDWLIDWMIDRLQCQCHTWQLVDRDFRPAYISSTKFSSYNATLLAR